MQEVMNEIMTTFISIRKKQNKLTKFGIVALAVLGVSSVFYLVMGFLRTVLDNTFVLSSLVISLAIAILSLFAVILIAEYEPPIAFTQQDLRDINDSLINHEIKGEENRKIFKEVVSASLKPKPRNLVGLSVFVGVLISPVFVFLRDAILEGNFLFSLDGGEFTIGAAMPIYVTCVFAGLLLVAALNVLRFVLEKDNARKKDLIRAIDEIDFWEKIKGADFMTTK